MRMCMVCPSYPPQDITCGVGDYTRCLSEELLRQGEEVFLVTSDRYKSGAVGLPVMTVKERDWTMGTAWMLTTALALRMPDLVHVQYTPDLYGRAMGFTVLPLLARLRRAGWRTVVTLHTLVGGPARTKLAAIMLLATAHHIISANEEVSALLRRVGWLAPSRWTEIPIGSNIPVAATDHADRQSVRERLGLPATGTVLAHFGLVYPGKGLETVIQALPRVLAAQPEACLVIVGDTREQEQGYEKSLREMADRLHVRSAIIWAGCRSNEEVSQILGSADLFVVPYDGGASIRRGSLMAGFAHGLPVISTHASVTSVYLRDGINVALVPPKAPRLLADRIIALVNDRESAAGLAEGASALTKEFSWPRIAQETRTLYARLVQK